MKTIRYEQIDENTVKKITEEIIDISKSNEEISDIDNRIANLESEPNEIIVPNLAKFEELENLKFNKQELNKQLDKKKGIK